jgi:drug/metabolite transporter (DMT)-like permease
MSQILALASAALYGLADFSGGLASRRTAMWKVVAWSQLLGLPLLVAGLLVVEASEVTTRDLVFGALAGILGLLGIAALYQALAKGSMSIVSPITGTLAALIPVVVGLALGEVVSDRQWVGIACALLAVVLVTYHRTATSLTAQVLMLSIVSALWFAAFFVALDQTSVDAGLWPLVAARVVSVPTAFAIARLRSNASPPDRSVFPIVAVAGFADMAANVAILLALQRGSLGTTSVLSSLYPVFTVLAAVVVLREHPNRVQWTGIGLALIAAVLLAV